MGRNEEFFRQRVAELRIKRNVSEVQMSRELGMSDGYINQISTGRCNPSMKTFYSICQYFSLDPLEFWDRENTNPDMLRQLTDLAKKLDPIKLQTVINIVSWIQS